MADTRVKERKAEIEKEIAKLKEELEIINQKGYSIGFICGFGSPDVAADFEYEVEKLLEKYDGELINKKDGANEIH